MEKLKVYLAGGITGLTYKEAFGWRQKATNKLAKLGVKCYNPLKSEDLERYSNGQDKFTSGDKLCYLRDKFMIKKSDIILINYDSIKNCGTFIEKGWGDADKLIIIFTKQNITHPFVTENAIIVGSLKDAIDIIKELR